MRKDLEDLKKADLAKTRSEIMARLEDIENTLAPMDEPIGKLTPSEDLEAVKGKVNQLIDELNRVLLSAD